MADFMTSLQAAFGRKLAKLRESVEDAFFNENTNIKYQKTRGRKWGQKIAPQWLAGGAEAQRPPG